MANILLRYPSGGGYTSTVSLNPALATVTRKGIAGAQHRRLAKSLQPYVFQWTTNRNERWILDIEHLHEADSGGNSGMTTLLAFFNSPVNYSASAIDITDADGTTLAGRYWSGLEEYTEGGGAQQRQSRAGRFFLSIEFVREN